MTKKKSDPKKDEIRTKLQISETRFRRLFETAQDGILIIDAVTGRIMEVNPFLMTMLGYSRSYFIGKRLWDIGAFIDMRASKIAFRELQTKKYIRYEDLPLKRKDGCLINVEFVSNVYKVDHKMVIQCNIRDITDRKKAESALKESEAKFKSIFYDSTNGMVLANIKTRRFYMCNKKICEFLGYTEKELKRLKVDDIHPKKALPHVIKQFKRQAREDFRVAAALPVQRKDGSIFYADVDASPLVIDGKKHLMGVFRDITAQRQMEASLLESRQKLADITNTIPGMVYEFKMTPSGKMSFVFASIGAKKLFGQDPNDLIMDFSIAWNMVLPEDTEQLRNSIIQSMRKRSPWWYEFRIKLKDGSIRWIRGSASIVRIDKDKSFVWDGVLSDVTERKRTEEALKMSEANYHSIFDMANDGIIIRDIQTYRVVDANRKACSMFHYTKKEMLGLDLRAIMTDNPGYAYRSVLPFYAKAAQGEPQLLEWLVKDKVGRTFWIEKNIRRAVIGNRYRILSIDRDITERKHLAEAKSDFINMVSHELRTPLSVIKESISLVSECKLGAVSRKQEEFLGIAKNNIDRLTRLINQALDLQKFDAGKMTLRVEDHNINEVAEEVYRGALFLTGKKHLKFTLKLGIDLPRLKFDKDKIVEVLFNFVNNAFKYTEEGSIDIITCRKNNAIQVSVKDTGCGIKEEDMPKLFQRFAQLERKPGGTGLGLAITKEIIELHGGKIWAESKQGKGSTFHFMLPLIRRRK